jgi:hypothetical protein
MESSLNQLTFNAEVPALRTAKRQLLDQLKTKIAYYARLTASPLFAHPVKMDSEHLPCREYVPTIVETKICIRSPRIRRIQQCNSS